jgi:hypothetical protein
MWAPVHGRPVAGRAPRPIGSDHDKVEYSRSVTLHYKGKLHHRCPSVGWSIVMLVDGLDIQVLGLGGSLLRHLTLDPSVDHQRMP